MACFVVELEWTFLCVDCNASVLHWGTAAGGTGGGCEWRWRVWLTWWQTGILPLPAVLPHIVTELFSAILSMFYCYFAPDPIGEQSIVMSMSVCQYVCLCVCLWAYLQNYTSDLHQILFLCFQALVHVTYGHGLVLLWQHCYKLCTSGFVDDILFAHL